jgi:Do/DeqQ family serine protease
MMMHDLPFKTYRLSKAGFSRCMALLLVALSLSGLVGGKAGAQEVRVPRSDAEIRLSYAPIVRQTAPAVVNVYVRKRVQQRVSPFLDDPFFRRFFGEGFGIPRDRVQNSLGSGVIVSPDGVVVTNHHVVKGGDEGEIKVAFADKREFPATVILTDERTDLAVLRIEGADEPFPYLEFDNSDSLQVGDLVLAVGNPFGVGQTVTSGIVSALARTHVGVSDYQFFIQTDAAINPGNSGGALVDMNGKLVGINTAIYSKTGGSHGIGFAIPSNMVRLVVRSAIEGKKVQRPWLGANLQAVTPDIAESIGLDRPAGALVKQIHPASPAAPALEMGDVIVGIDGKPVPDPGAFRYHFSTEGIGGEAVIDIVRAGRLAKVRIPLEQAPEIPPRNETEIGGRNPFTGAVVANLSPALSEELGLETQGEGTIILDIKPGSLAMGTRFLREGDIVVAVNGVEVKRVADLQKALEKSSSQWRISVNRGGRILNVVFGS